MPKTDWRNIERLETISIKLKKISKAKRNPIIKDMIWLADRLREAYLMMEKL